MSEDQPELLFIESYDVAGADLQCLALLWGSSSDGRPYVGAVLLE